jgi:hypothetical protein
MYPCYGDYWLTGTSSPHDYDYDYEDEEYDVYLFWPSSSPQLMVPSDTGYLDEVRRCLAHRISPSLIPRTQLRPLPSLDSLSDTDDGLDVLELGSSEVLVRPSVPSLPRDMASHLAEPLSHVHIRLRLCLPGRPLSRRIKQEWLQQVI